MRIDEIRAALLYHWMDPEKALLVFHNDLLEPRWEHDIPGLGRFTGTSLSRNSNMYWPGYSEEAFIRLVLDENRIRQTNRIIPLDADRAARHTQTPERDWHAPGDREQNTFNNQQFAEEFVIGVIRPLHRYLVRIDVWWDMIGIEAADHEEAIAETINQYAQRFSIAVSNSYSRDDR